MNHSPVCAVVGVGPGNGQAISHRFANAGHEVAVFARSADFVSELADELPTRATGGVVDVTEPDALVEALERAETELGPIDTLVWNAGAGAFETIEDASAEQLESAWRVNTAGLFTGIRHVIPGMIDRGRGNIIGIGATASLRGGAGFLPFASAKAAQKNLLESCARHLGPKGIHVAYLIIDGVVDLPRTRESMPDKPDSFFIQPEGVADAAYYLTTQDRSAWTFQLDLRPDCEDW